LILTASALFSYAQTAEELGVAKRSAFDDSTIQRDPFLPIGWNQPVLVQGPVHSGVSAPPTIESFIRPEAFVISSILFDKIPLAVINGKAYGEGDSMPFNAGGTQIKLQVFAIRDGVVTLQYGEFKVACPIRVYQKPTPPRK